MSLFFLLWHFWATLAHSGKPVYDLSKTFIYRSSPFLLLLFLLFIFLSLSLSMYFFSLCISSLFFLHSIFSVLLLLSFYIVIIFCLNLLWSLSFSVSSLFIPAFWLFLCAATRLWTERPRNGCSVFNKVKKFFPTSKASRPSLEPAQPSTQWVPEVPYPGVNGVNLLVTKLSMRGALSQFFHTSSWRGA
jgi:hypothetical protein